MMFLLISNVCRGFLDARHADAESSITFLPSEKALIRKSLMNPF